MDRQGVKHMDTWQNISRRIRTVKSSYKVRKYIFPGKFLRTEMQHIGIKIGDDQKQGHSHHHIKNQLIILVLVFIQKNEIHYRYDHIRKPEKVGDDKNLTKRNHIVKHCMYHMVSMNRQPFQIEKQQQVNAAVDQYNKAVFVFFAKFQQSFTFLKNSFVQPLLLVQPRYKQED